MPADDRVLSVLIFVSMDHSKPGIAFSKSLKAVFKSHADSERAQAMERYMRDQFRFFGLPAPQRKELVGQFHSQWKQMAMSAALAAVQWLWVQDERECQYAAMELIQRRHKEFIPEHLVLIEEMIVGKSWWDTVDFIAANIAGPYFLRFPDQMEADTERWNRSGNLWLRRSSIIFQLKYRQKTREDLLFAYCANCAHERDFFIRKAIGWALRQYAKTEPEHVRHFLSTHQFSALSVKEAEKSLT